MHHVSASRRPRPDPDAASFRELGRRLDALRAVADPTPAEVAELRRLEVVWAHMQPTPAPRPARRHGTPARLPAHD